MKQVILYVASYTYFWMKECNGKGDIMVDGALCQNWMVGR